MLELTLRLIASLAVVVGLLLLLARFAGRRFRGQSGALVRVVHRQPLSRTSSVAVVTVGSRVLVLGTTEQQVSILTELDPDDLAAGLLETLPSDGGLETTPGPFLLPAIEAPARGTRPGGAHRAAASPAKSPAAAGDGALTGSVLSPGTWRQALAAATGKAS